MFIQSSYVLIMNIDIRIPFDSEIVSTLKYYEGISSTFKLHTNFCSRETSIYVIWFVILCEKNYWKVEFVKKMNMQVLFISAV